MFKKIKVGNDDIAVLFAASLTHCIHHILANMMGNGLCLLYKILFFYLLYFLKKFVEISCCTDDFKENCSKSWQR